MLSIQTIHPNTLELLKQLASQPELSQTRLVGGTALALQYGHRQSIDLDFFGVLPEDKEELLEMMSRVGNMIVTNRTKMIVDIRGLMSRFKEMVSCWHLTKI